MLDLFDLGQKKKKKYIFLIECPKHPKQVVYMYGVYGCCGEACTPEVSSSGGDLFAYRIWASAK